MAHIRIVETDELDAHDLRARTYTRTPEVLARKIVDRFVVDNSVLAGRSRAIVKLEEDIAEAIRVYERQQRAR